MSLLSLAKAKFDAYRLRRRWKNLRARGMHIGKHVNFPMNMWVDIAHCHLISVGDRCGFGQGCAILTHDAMPNEFLDATRVARTTIHESCHFGMGTIILPGVTIGPRSIVGAGSLVNQDIPPDSVAAGNPARVICTLEEYLEKQKAILKDSPQFPFYEYSEEYLNPEKIRFMRDKLGSGVGYVTGGYAAMQHGKGMIRTE
jgi:maltose O-acetyltransferase